MGGNSFIQAMKIVMYRSGIAENISSQGVVNVVLWNRTGHTVGEGSKRSSSTKWKDVGAVDSKSYHHPHPNCCC